MVFWNQRQWHPTPVLLPGKSHGRQSLVGCSPWGRWELDMTQWIHFHFSLPCIGEGNGNPLWCSCLENPRDGGAWWAAVYGIAQSQTRLKRLDNNNPLFLNTWHLPESVKISLGDFVGLVIFHLVISKFQSLGFLFNFLFCHALQLINNTMIISGEQQRDSAIHIHVSVLPPTPPAIQDAREHWTEIPVLCGASLIQPLNFVFALLPKDAGITLLDNFLNWERAEPPSKVTEIWT